MDVRVLLIAVRRCGQYYKDRPLTGGPPTMRVYSDINFKKLVHRRLDAIIEFGSFLAHSPIIDFKILKSILGKSNYNPFIIKINVNLTFFL